MKRYAKSKARRVLGADDASKRGVDEEEEIAVLRERISIESPAPGTQLRSKTGLKFESLPLSFKTISALQKANLTAPTDIQAASLPHALCGRDILGAAKTGSGKTLAFVIPIIEKLYRERWSPADGLGAVIISPTRELALQIFEVLRIVGKNHDFSAGLITGGKKEFDEERSRIVKMNILVATPGRLLQHFEQSIGFDASQLMILVLDEADRILDMGFKHQLDSIISYLPSARQTMLFSATQTKSVKDLARLSLRDPEYLSVHAEDAAATPTQLVQNYIVCPLHEKLDVLYSFVKTHLKSKIIIFFSTCSQARFVYECFRGMQPGIPLSTLHGKIKQEKRTMVYMDFVRRKNAACMIATDIAARGLDFPHVDWVIQADAPEDAAMYIHRAGRTARYTSEGRSLLMLIPEEEKKVMQDLKCAPAASAAASRDGGSSNARKGQGKEKGGGGATVEASDNGVTNALGEIPIKKLTVNPRKTFSVTSRAAALLAEKPECRNLAKKAFRGYLRSLQLLPGNRAIDVRTLPLDAFGASLGLGEGFTPDIPLVVTERTKVSGSSGNGSGNGSGDMGRGNEGEGLDAVGGVTEETRQEIRDKKNVNRSLDKLKRQIKETKERKKLERLAIEQSRQRVNGSGAAQESKEDADGDDEDEEDDLLAVKQVHNWAEADNSPTAMIDGLPQTHVQAQTLSGKKLRKLKVNMDGEAKHISNSIGGLTAAGSRKTVFDDEGNALPAQPVLRSLALSGTSADQAAGADDTVERARRIEAYAESVKARLQSTKKEDLQREKQRVREKRLAAAAGRDGKKGEDEDEDDEVEGRRGGVQLLVSSDQSDYSDSGGGSVSDSESTKGENESSNSENDDDEEEEEEGRSGMEGERASGRRKAALNVVSASDSQDGDSSNDEEEDSREGESSIYPSADSSRDKLLGRKRSIGDLKRSDVRQQPDRRLRGESIEVEERGIARKKRAVTTINTQKSRHPTTEAAAAVPDSIREQEELALKLLLG